jgi:DNA-binding MarR family transcriptional regulator
MIRNIARSSKVAASVQEEEILRSMRRIIRAVDLYSRRLIAQTGLSGPQLTCLRALARGGSMQTFQLADAVHLSAATVCGILNRLEQRGLVARARQTDDRRRVLVSLTEAGEDTVENAPPVLHDKFLLKLRALPPDEQQSMQETLAAIVDMMAASELDAAPLLEPGDAVTPGPDDQA